VFWRIIFDISKTKTMKKAIVKIEYKAVNYSGKNYTESAIKPVAVIYFDNGMVVSFSSFLADIANTKVLSQKEDLKWNNRQSVAAMEKFANKWAEKFYSMK
jgi:hypothetical protein